MKNPKISRLSSNGCYNQKKDGIKSVNYKGLKVADQIRNIVHKLI